jgi:hypothetical protein
VRLVLSRLETRNAASLLSRCKTFAYGGSLLARREARARGADDALLASSAGGLCCATAANLLVRLDGRWCTPPLSSGCLPGILRGLALEQGLAVERPLSPEDLGNAEGALLINSLGCRPVLNFEGMALPASSSRQSALEAEALWRVPRVPSKARHNATLSGLPHSRLGPRVASKSSPAALPHCPGTARTHLSPGWIGSERSRI